MFPRKPASDMKKRFADKVVWITGAGSGIGRALALALARQGAKLALSGRREAKLLAVAEEVRSLGSQADIFVVDVSDDGAVEEAVAAVVGRFGKIDVAIANAGMGVIGRFEKLSDAEWRRQMDVNLFGVVNTARHALPELRKTRGRLALVCSVSGLLCTPASSAYSASKFAVRAIGLSLSMELHGSGVSCTTIHPGFVESEINRVDNAGVYHEGRPDRRPARLMWPAGKAAGVMVDAIFRRKREFTFTAHGKFGAFLGKHMPATAHAIITRFVAKGASTLATRSDSD